MSRPISNAAKTLMKWAGYDRTKLQPEYKKAIETYSQNGAVKKVGPISKIEILHRNDGSSPVHQSKFNPKDKEFIISARITPASGGPAKTHHIYKNGTGTMKKGDKKEFSTTSKTKKP